MLTPDMLHDYQKRAVNFQCSMPSTMIWMDLGLGKTSVTLTSIAHLLACSFLRGVVIVAPIRVIRLVWRQEALKWSHTRHLTFSMLTGTKDQRTRALLRPANIYLVNYENLGWLAEVLQTYFISKQRPLPFDGVVWDEISKCKNSTTDRVKATRKILPHFKWATGLTGTPASNGYQDLHGQYLVVDKGERLGTSKTAFKSRFYRKAGPYKELPYDGAENEIKQLIGDITLEMSAEDYNKLPDLVVNDINIEMPSELRTMYDRMEREFFILLDSGKEVEMFNQAALTNKCLAEGTEILTERGWLRIEDYSGERVWDGVEWVSTFGLVGHGYKKVVELWGVWMTPDHNVLTTQGWVTAQEVLDGKSCNRYDWSSVRTPYSACEGREQDNPWDISASTVESPLRLRQRDSGARNKPSKHSSRKQQIMWLFARGDGDRGERFSRDESHSAMGHLVQHGVEMLKCVRQGLVKLRRAWDNSVPGVVDLRGVLARYVKRVSGPSDIGTSGCEPGVLAGKLSVGHEAQTSEQHTIQRVHSNPPWSDDSGASSEAIQVETHHSVQENQSGVGHDTITQTCKVYDLLNAGPRHRFTVRGRGGEVFIVHNCLQFANGAMYPVAGMPLWEPIHDLKLEALEEIIDEAQGQQVLCSYGYRSDAERIMKKFHHLRPINLTECKSESALVNAMARWTAGDCPLMIGHPASMGHGIDGLQKAGHTVVWYGLNWSLDLYDQMNARIRRQGQGAPVICHRILMLDTLDQAQALALTEKASTQAGLRNAVKQYRLTRGI